MRLVFCQSCQDVFSLRADWKKCICGDSGGKHEDGIYAVVSGQGVVLSFSNESLARSIELTRKDGSVNKPFKAYVLTADCAAVKQL